MIIPSYIDPYRRTIKKYLPPIPGFYFLPPTTDPVIVSLTKVGNPGIVAPTVSYSIDGWEWEPLTSPIEINTLTYFKAYAPVGWGKPRTNTSGDILAPTQYFTLSTSSPVYCGGNMYSLVEDNIFPHGKHINNGFIGTLAGADLLNIPWQNDDDIPIPTSNFAKYEYCGTFMNSPNLTDDFTHLDFAVESNAAQGCFAWTFANTGLTSVNLAIDAAAIRAYENTFHGSKVSHIDGAISAPAASYYSSLTEMFSAQSGEPIDSIPLLSNPVIAQGFYKQSPLNFATPATISAPTSITIQEFASAAPTVSGTLILNSPTIDASWGSFGEIPTSTNEFLVSIPAIVDAETGENINNINLQWASWQGHAVAFNLPEQVHDCNLFGIYDTAVEVDAALARSTLPQKITGEFRPEAMFFRSDITHFTIPRYWQTSYELQPWYEMFCSTPLNTLTIEILTRATFNFSNSTAPWMENVPENGTAYLPYVLWHTKPYHDINNTPFFTRGDNTIPSSWTIVYQVPEDVQYAAHEEETYSDLGEYTYEDLFGTHIPEYNQIGRFSNGNRYRHGVRLRYSERF